MRPSDCADGSLLWGLRPAACGANLRTRVRGAGRVFSRQATVLVEASADGGSARSCAALACLARNATGTRQLSGLHATDPPVVA